MAKEMDRDQILIVQETEYTGAGKHPTAQLTFARSMGIEIRRGDPDEDRPGQNVVIPERADQVRVRDVNLDEVRRSYLANRLGSTGEPPDGDTTRHLAAETKLSEEDALRVISEILMTST